MKNFTEGSSIHGVKYIFMRNNSLLSKVSWALALFISFCGFSFYIYSAFVKLQLDPETVMKVRERNSSEFPAPAITVCSNLFARNNTANFLKSYREYANKIDLNMTQEECLVFAANIHWCQPSFTKFVYSLCQKYNYDAINVLEVINKSALNVDEGLFLCFDGMCDDLIFKIFSDFGMCYTQNMMSASMIFNTENIHEDFKKIITKFNNESEPLWTPEKGYKNNHVDFPPRASRDYYVGIMPTLSDVDKDNICALKTFRLFIHKPNEFVTPFHESILLNYEEFIMIRVTPQSYKTDIALVKFPFEVRKCYFDGEKKLKFFKTYTKALCEWECRANATLKDCGCVKFSMPRDKSTRVCNTTELTCVVFAQPSKCNCYAPCVDLKYTFKADRTQFNRNFFTTGLPSPDSTMSWAEISIDVEILEEIENFVSYKLQNFISDFGGLLGLFMGCSLLSFIEIFHFVINGGIQMLRPSKTTPENEKWAEKPKRKLSISDLERRMNQNDEKLSNLLMAIGDLKKNSIQKNFII